MFTFALNILLMFAWAILTTNFSAINLIIGYVLGWLILWMIRWLYGPTPYYSKPVEAILLVAEFIKQLVASSIEVLWEVITPGDNVRPGILDIPLDLKTETQIMLLANFISLTPGTLSLEVSADQKTLYIHSMFLDDPEHTRRTIKETIEKRILELFEDDEES